MSIAATAEIESAPSNPIPIRLAVACACAGLADWLFFDWDVGISLALFLGLLGIAAITVNPIHANHRTRLLMSAVFVAGLAALIESVNLLSVTTGLLTTSLFVIVMTAREDASWQRDLFEAVTIPFRGPFRLLIDLTNALRHMKQRSSEWLGSLIAWIVPLSIFVIFLSLFYSANPLIENQLKWVDLTTIVRFFEAWRVALWIAIICTVWPLLHRRFKPKPFRMPEIPTLAEPSDIDYLFGATAMVRSLILFNMLFALQSLLDFTYLWGGVNLPDGMSNAEYAHRGAYPLVATALLAAVFVLIAMRQGGPAENNRLIRPLVLAWIGQNILLVISSIFRLDLYVAAFSLTYLRLAAFIWMVLVAIGLVLILTQIVRRKSTAWLLSANALSLALVLYGCCFLNATPVITAYNLAHSRDVSGEGPWIDWKYIVELGPAALPVLEQHQPTTPTLQYIIKSLRDRQDIAQLMAPKNWRTWTFRTWRLKQYFAKTPVEQTTPLNSDQG